jgi:glycosyltransferase involved in cell wall biosynthesis
MFNKVIIATSAPPDRGSGISTYSKELAMEFRRRGAAVTYVSPHPANTAWLEKWGISLFSVDPFRNQVQSARQLLDHIRKEKITAAINSDNSILQSIAPKLTCPIIAVGHLDSSAIARVACLNYAWIDHVIAISDDMQRCFINKFGVPPAKCPVVYNGIGDPGEPLMQPYDGRRRLKIIVMGEHSHRKGGDLIEKMIHNPHPAWDKIKLEWFGRVPPRTRRAVSKKTTVTIHGRVPRRQVLNALAQADVFLLASRREGCPMAMIEAMSYGVIPIASDGIGAMQGLITHGYDGFICRLNDWPHQALDCIHHFIEHPGVLQAMRSLTRKRFLSELTTQRVVDRLMELLQMPTVDRSHPANRIRILKWHRLSHNGTAPTLLERIFFKYGIIRYAGWLDDRAA